MSAYRREVAGLGGHPAYVSRRRPMNVLFRNMKGEVGRKEKVQLIQVIKEKEKTWKEAAAKV